MGNVNEKSALIPAPRDFRHMVLFFSLPDRITLLYGQTEAINIVRGAVEQYWPDGIDSEEKDVAQRHCFKLKHSPFDKHRFFQEAVNSKMLTCQILTDLFAVGWRLVLSTHLSRRTDLNTWIFSRDEPTILPKRICCVSLSGSDRLLLVNADQKLSQIFQKVMDTYKLGHKVDRSNYNVVEYVLKGHPWETKGEARVHARRLIKDIISQLYFGHYFFYGTGNIKGTADTLYFKYDKNADVDPNARFFTLSLSKTDRMRLVDAPEKVVEMVRGIVAREWPAGLARVGDFFGATELVLNGTPWATLVDEEIINGRQMLCKLFTELLLFGWEINTTFEMARSAKSKSVFIFRSCSSELMIHSCISLNGFDQMRLISFPDAIRDAVREQIVSLWSKGINKITEEKGDIMIRLKGEPWAASRGGGGGLQARGLMVHLLNLLEQRQWEVVCSADVSALFLHHAGSADEPLDVHSWFVRQVCGPANHSAF